MDCDCDMSEIKVSLSNVTGALKNTNVSVKLFPLVLYFIVWYRFVNSDFLWLSSQLSELGDIRYYDKMLIKYVGETNLLMHLNNSYRKALTCFVISIEAFRV